MGASRWSDDHYKEKAAFRVKTDKPVFAYDADVRAGKTSAKANDKMNPLDVKVRECRDSDAHPESVGVGVFFDVTGSMAEVPGILQKNLPKLMGLLLRKSYLTHPAIMVGAFGDAHAGSRAPLQVGQFESGIEIEGDLEKLYLEGGGGGSIQESSELVLYFMARKTVSDCLEKRGKKGYLFLITDEMPYGEACVKQVKSIIGDALQDDVSLEVLVEEVKQKYELFVIIPNMTNHWNDEAVHEVWRKLVGQNYLKLEDPEAVCELIASQIGICEGVEIDRVDDDLKEAGTNKKIRKAVAGALVPSSGGGRVATLPDSGAASGLTKL